MNFPTLVGATWAYTSQPLDNNQWLLAFFHDGTAGNKSLVWRPDGTYRIKSLVYSSSLYLVNEVFLIQVLCTNVKVGGTTSSYLYQKYEQTLASAAGCSYNGCVDLHSPTAGTDNDLNFNIFTVHPCYATFLVERIPTANISTDNPPMVIEVPKGKCGILDWVAGKCPVIKEV